MISSGVGGSLASSSSVQHAEEGARLLSNVIRPGNCGIPAPNQLGVPKRCGVVCAEIKIIATDELSPAC
jgi:hypothetical protein